MCAAATARAATSGCTSSVTSVAVPPVLRLALLRRIDALALGRHRVGRQTLHGQARDGDVVEADLGQRGGMAGRRGCGSLLTCSTSSRTVCAPSPITCGRVAAGRGHQLARPPPAGGSRCRAGSVSTITSPILGGGRVGDLQLLAADDVDGHALALVAVLRFDHHRQAVVADSWAEKYRFSDRDYHRGVYCHQWLLYR